MRLSLDNFDEKSLPPHNGREPHLTLHNIRQILKKEPESAEAKSATEAELMMWLKKLVDFGSLDLPKVPLNNKKDIFNMLAARITDWTAFAAEEGVLGLLEPGRERLPLVLQALSALTISGHYGPPEKVDDSSVLIEMMQQSEDPRVIIFASRLMQTVGKAPVLGQPNPLLNLNEKVLRLALSHHQPDSSQKQLRLADILRGTSPNGESIFGADLKLEVQQGGASLNDKRKTKTFTAPLSQIISAEPASKVAEDLTKAFEEFTGSQDPENKAIFVDRVIWLRYLNSGITPVEALLFITRAIIVACSEKGTQSDPWFKEQVFEEIIEAIQLAKDKTLICELLSAVTVINKMNVSRGGENLSNALLKIPPAEPGSEPGDSFAVKVLKDITKFEGGEPSTIPAEIARSSHFQRVFLHALRVVASYPHRGTINPLEVTPTLAPLLSIVSVDNIVDQRGHYTYNLKVVSEALEILKSNLKARHEEQYGFVAKFEQRLEFEVRHLDPEESKLTTAPEGEDYAQVQDSADRSQVMKLMVALLFEMVQRGDRENLGINRKIIESQIMQQMNRIAEFNTKEKGHLVDGFISYYFLLIGQICSDFIAQTPMLIRSGVLPAMYKAVSLRVPDSPEAIQYFLFAYNHTTLQEEGRKLAEDMGVFEKVLQHIATEGKYYESTVSTSNTRVYLFNIFERLPSQKEIGKKYLKIFLKMTHDLIKVKSAKYYAIYNRTDIDLKAKNALLSSPKFNESQTVKKLRGLFSLISSFTNTGEERHERGHGNNRIVQELYDEESFKLMLDGIFEAVAQCPFHMHHFHQYLVKCLRVLLDKDAFAANLKLFIERYDKAHQDLLSTVQRVERFDFDDHSVRETSALEEQGDRRGPETMQKLLRIILFCKTICQLHSGSTLLDVCTNNQVVSSVRTLFLVHRILSKMRVDVLHSRLSSEDPEEKRISQTTQAEFATLPAEEQVKLRGKIYDSQFYSNENLIRDLIPMGAAWQIPIKAIHDFLMKFTDVSYAPSRDPNARGIHKTQQYNNQAMLGNLCSLLSKQLREQSLADSITFDDNEKCYKALFNKELVIDELNRYASRGWLSGVAFFQFYQEGGLADLIQALHWFGRSQSKILQPGQLQLNANNFEWCCSTLSSILTKYVIEDEKTAQDRDHQRHLEVYFHSIVSYKMDPHFENAKDFFNNVIFNLLTDVFTPGVDNPLTHFLGDSLQTGFPELIVLILNSIQQSFKNCYFLKMAQGGHHYEPRDPNRRGRQAPPPNPLNVQQLEDMGFALQGFSRERIVEALQQSRDRVDAAAELLFQWQGMGLFESANAVEQAQPASALQATGSPQRKLQKVNEAQCADLIKRLQRQGFEWIIEIIDRVDPSKVQGYLIDALKKETSEDQMSKMYAKVDAIFKGSLDRLQENLKGISEVNTDSDPFKETIALLQKSSNSVRIIQRIIMNSKKYLEEAVVKSSVAKVVLQHLNFYATFIKETDVEAFKKHKAFLYFNKLIYDAFVLLLSATQMVHLVMATTDSADKPLRKSFPSQPIFSLCIELASLAASGLLKQQLVVTSLALALRIIMDKGCFDTKDQRIGAASILFELLNELASKKALAKFDQKIISSISILNFEHESLVTQQIEKFASRVLLLKAEHEAALPANKDKPDQGAELTKINFRHYLGYLSALSAKDKTAFQKAVQESCKVKNVRNGNPDSATIYLKEAVFTELRKTVGKERVTFKQLVKTVDLGNEKQFKTAKKALLSHIPEVGRLNIETFITYVMGTTAGFAEEFNKFADGGCKALVVPKDYSAPIFESQYTILDMLAKLCLAYPAFTAVLLPSKQNIKNRNFFQWYIKEYLVSLLLTRNNIEKEEGSEVSYKVVGDLQLFDQNVRVFLNTLTGYNYLMTLNEQLVKHQLRCKFMLQALHTLHKVIKDKQSSDSPVRQRALILASLSVIEGLINGQSQQAKQATISSDNFANSLRVCFVRDGANKDLNLPYSLLRILDELMTDVVDVSNAANSDIVGKCVSILKVVGEFVNAERKKAEGKSSKRARASLELEENKQNPADVRMEPVAEVMQQRAASPRLVMERAGSRESSESEEEDQLQHVHGHDNQVDDDDDYGQEDHGMDHDEEDLAEGDDDDDEEEEVEPVAELMHIEDELDDYDEEEEELDPNLHDMLMMRGERRGAAAQNDIINPNVRGDNHDVHHFGYPRYGLERPQARQNVDWTEEEAQVQRILSNLQGAQAQIDAPPVRHYNRDPWGMPGAPRQNNMNVAAAVSIVKQTYENFQVLSEKELYDIVMQQRVLFEIAEIQTIALPRRDMNHDRYRLNNHIFGGGPGMNEHINRLLGRVDELDDDFHQMLRERILGDEIEFGFDNPFGHFLNRDRHAERLAQQQENQFDNSDFNNALRQTLQRQDQVQAENLAIDILRGTELQEEERPAQPAPEQPRQQTLASRFMNNVGQPPQDPYDIRGDDLMQSFLESMAASSLNPANPPPPLNEFQLPPALQIPAQIPVQAPPQLIPSQPVAEEQQLAGELEEVRRQIEEAQSRFSHENSQVQQELQRIVQSAQVEESSLQDDVLPEESQIPSQVAQQQEQIQPQPDQPVDSEGRIENMMQQLSIPAEEEKRQEEAGRTFGYDNQFLLDNGIDPAILAELPEDLRIELLSTIEVQPPQQPPVVRAEEEKKDAEQPAAQQQPQPPAQQRPEYFAIAQELGIDLEFLENLPEEMRLELIQQQQQQQQQPARQAEDMDMASFIATVTDPNLRREIFMGMDEAAIANLPPNLMAEARNIHDGRRQRDAERMRVLQEMGMPGRGLGMGENDLFGMPRRYAADGMRQPGNRHAPPRDKTLEEIICARQTELANETQGEDIAQAICSQLVQNEKILEALLLILLANDKAQCDLVPALIAMTKIQSSSGVPVIRNKLVNALTFLLKAIGSNDVEALKALLPQHDLKLKQSALILIGTVRLLLKSNKGLMKYILKGLITKEDGGKPAQTQILKKHLKALRIEEEKQRSFQPPSTLAEIFSLIKSEGFKKDKALMRNLSLLIQQILKQFDIAKEELELSSQQISLETVQSIAEVLSLDSIEQNLLEALGEFFFQLSLKRRENFELIKAYCSGKSAQVIEKLNDRLMEIVFTFQHLNGSGTPHRQLGALELRAFSSNSGYEEEKGDHEMIDTSSLQVSKSKQYRLPAEEEKQMRQLLRFNEDSEVLFRIFKLINQFYEKFNQQQPGEMATEVAQYVKGTYEQDAVTNFIKNVSDVMRIVYRANVDMSEAVSNVIFCVFSSFYPELIDSIKEEEKRNALPADKADKAEKGKYTVKMAALTEAQIKSKEKFTLFKNSEYFTPRIEQLNAFCLANKRLINKLIKSKPALFVNELEGLIRHMPNLLDFENKRVYFRKELHKLRRGQYQGSVELFIRRDNIFRDSYEQLSKRNPEELKARFHVNFNGERGQDAGGLTRDFFIELSREMFNPNYSLFTLSSSGATYYPNPKSHIIGSDHLNYFKFIGRIIGKAIFDECLLECYFVKALYKIISGEELSIKDLEDFDNEYYNNLKWCLENDVACLMTTMVVEQDYYGKVEEIELVPGGRSIPLTNENKWVYVEKIAHYRLYKSIAKQIDKFLEGFYELVPKDLISVFNFKELELLISGLPNFDLDDLKANTEYSGYSATSPQVLWLWEVLEVLDNSERAEFLQFVTGSSKVPLDGFKGLIGMRGPQKFTIAKIKSDDIMRLPSGHTCFNQLDLPEYPSKEILHERLLLAIKETKGFGFA